MRFSPLLIVAAQLLYFVWIDIMRHMKIIDIYMCSINIL